ncbi:hypothetical protein IKF43_01365 [Candidatus Saccharibacteria bacterium]|nr:hypothetical protein [Candidatus Saccharibacteria bacterium]
MNDENKVDLFGLDDDYSEIDADSDRSRLDDALDTIDDARDIAKKIKDRRNASNDLRSAENNATNNGLNDAGVNTASKAGKAGTDTASKAGTDAAGKAAEGATKVGADAAATGASGSTAAGAAGSAAASGSSAAAGVAGTSAAAAGAAGGGAAAGGAAAGAGAGAAAGSVAPGVGTAIGAAVGVAIGVLKDKKARATIALIAVGLIAGVIVLLAAPVAMIASIDYKLQESLGFSDIIAVLEEQAEYITAEFMSTGEVPSNYASDLAKNGIEIGQVTASGEFVRTNTYIANIDENRSIATNGMYFDKDDEGELVALFDGQVVEADNFVAMVESNPKMYAAYSDALDISARYFYSNDVNDVYKNMGLSRGSFNGWDGRGTSEENEEEFNKLINKILDNDPAATVNGYCDDGCDDEEVKTTNISGDNADEIVGNVADNTTGKQSTAKAAQLLNTAISSSEPYKAASAFMAIEEPIQRARIDGDGPVNELMNLLTNAEEVSYIDVNTGEETKKKVSILNTGNFVAATSGGGYSSDEAANFSRDRVLNVTNEENSEVISGTTVSIDGNKKSNSVLGIGKIGSADKDILSKANDSVKIAVVDDNRELFTSVVGGNRVVEGGSFLANSIGSQTLGAMPSDVQTIAEYHQEVEEVLARRKAADRATLSPFDISSPNTFFGSLVYGFGAALIRNSNGTVLFNAGAIASYTSSSVADLIGDTLADGSNDDDFTTIAGNCDTVKAATDVEGDLYCTSHNTVSTKYMKNTKEDWKNAGIGVGEDGKVEDESELSKFIAFGMGREVTVGVMSSDVCERYKAEYASWFDRLLDKALDAIGLYQSCRSGLKEVPSDIANGAKYTLSGDYKSNVEKYSGFVLYDTVASLLEEKESSTSLFKKEYYAKYPKDNSAAGVISRRSGMSEEEAKVAINYASYLNVIANYDASVRYAFGKTTFVAPQKDLIENDEIMQIGLYCVWCKKMQYADVRNRNFAA